MEDRETSFRARVWKIWLVIIVLGLGFAATHKAMAAEEQDRSASQAVIEAQLKAFQNDDAPSAFKLASPSVQRLFRDPNTFVTMVKRDYSVVYRPSSVQFVKFQSQGPRVIHAVQMVDQNMVLWNVYYLLEKFPKGEWRISSCDIEKAAIDLI